MGAWMDVNSEAIYDTRAIMPYKQDRICYTKSKVGYAYAIYLVKENEKIFPQELNLTAFKDDSIKKVEILGLKEQINWHIKDENLSIHIPPSLRKKLVEDFAIAFKISLNE